MPGFYFSGLRDLGVEERGGGGGVKLGLAGRLVHSMHGGGVPTT